MKKKMYNQPIVETAQVKSAAFILAGSIPPGPPVDDDSGIEDGD